MSAVVKRRKWLPSLRYTHFGYFVIAIAVAVTHLALALDTVDPSRLRNSLGRVVILRALHGHIWITTVGHGVAVTLILTGMYWPRHFRLCRIGFAFSVVMFNTLGVAFLLAAVEYHLSFLSAIMCVAMSLASLAGYREPVINPFSAKPTS